MTTQETTLSTDRVDATTSVIFYVQHFVSATGRWHFSSYIYTGYPPWYSPVLHQADGTCLASPSQDGIKDLLAWVRKQRPSFNFRAVCITLTQLTEVLENV